MSFNNLSLDPKIIKAVLQSGYKNLTEIQQEAIPQILKGVDVRGSAQTGTGKTAAFLLPILNRLASPSTEKGIGPRALIIVPTRELAGQITEQANKYSRYLSHLKTVCINGGVSYKFQMQKLSKPYEILIATPGRLVDYIKQQKISFSRLEVLVFDEADQMLDMGFAKDVEKIVASIPKKRQTLLFSATMNNLVMKLSQSLLNNPVDVIVHAENKKHENIEQTLHYVDCIKHKGRLLDHYLSKEKTLYSIIFTSTKRYANQLVKELDERGYKAHALHGDMNQSQRTKTIKKMKEGKIKTLVATDVAARGLDVQNITHVINFDLPRTAEDYVHRIGRTGRAGANGTALSFAGKQDVGLVKKIEKFTGHSIDVKVIEGLEPTQKKSRSNLNKPRRNKANNGFLKKKKSNASFNPKYKSRFKSSKRGAKFAKA